MLHTDLNALCNYCMPLKLLTILETPPPTMPSRSRWNPLGMGFFTSVPPKIAISVARHIKNNRHGCAVSFRITEPTRLPVKRRTYNHTSQNSVFHTNGSLNIF